MSRFDRKNIYIALENVRSIHNVGSIMRTMSFFGFYKLLLVGYSGVDYDHYDRKVLHKGVAKTALGAEQDVNYEFLNSSEDLLSFVKQNDLKLVCVEQSENSISVQDYEFRSDAVLVFGNEVNGISDYLLQNCSQVVEIPRIGKKQSLNVAEAVTVVLA